MTPDILLTHQICSISIQRVVIHLRKWEKVAILSVDKQKLLVSSAFQRMNIAKEDSRFDVIRHLISPLSGQAIGTCPIPGSFCSASIEPKDMEAGPAFDLVGSMDDGLK